MVLDVRADCAAFVFGGGVLFGVFGLLSRLGGFDEALFEDPCACLCRGSLARGLPIALGSRWGAGP